MSPRRAPKQIDARSQPSVRGRRRDSRRSSETMPSPCAPSFRRFCGGRRRATRAPKAICALWCSHHITPLLTKCPNILQPTGYPTRGKYYNQPRVHTTSHHFSLNAHMYLHNNGVKWCKVAWRNNSAHTHSHKLYLWLRSTAAVSGAQRPRPHRILRVSEGPSILAWPTLNMLKNYRGRIWSEATKDCLDFLGFLRALRY